VPMKSPAQIADLGGGVRGYCAAAGARPRTGEGTRPRRHPLDNDGQRFDRGCRADPAPRRNQLSDRNYQAGTPDNALSRSRVRREAKPVSPSPLKAFAMKSVLKQVVAVLVAVKALFVAIGEAMEFQATQNRRLRDRPDDKC
jgi:hypothetical protein